MSKTSRSNGEAKGSQQSVKASTFGKNKIMERVVNLHIQKLPEGYYLTTSDSVQGLVAQGRTIAETIEIARDIAKKLIEAQDDSYISTLIPLTDSFDYPMIVGI